MKHRYQGTAPGDWGSEGKERGRKHEHFTNTTGDYDAGGLRFRLWDGGIKMETK